MSPAGAATALAKQGYLLCPPDTRISAWAEAARKIGVTLTGDPDLRARWLRHEGTWFAGVDVLPNAPDGSLGGTPLAGGAVDLLAPLALSPGAWHRGQLSVTYPGYPRAGPEDSVGAARFRRRRDAAHLDGLLPVGPARQRQLHEPHAFILGIALTEADPDAAPFTIWPGSHHRLGAALAARLRREPRRNWRTTDLTDTYAEARRAEFTREGRTEVPLAVGETLLIHRRLLHGIAPWKEGARAAPEGRMIAWFRPQLSGLDAWLPPQRTAVRP